MGRRLASRLKVRWGGGGAAWQADSRFGGGGGGSVGGTAMMAAAAAPAATTTGGVGVEGCVGRGASLGGVRRSIGGGESRFG